jgi:hypothetical protein
MKVKIGEGAYVWVSSSELKLIEKMSKTNNEMWFKDFTPEDISSKNTLVAKGLLFYDKRGDQTLYFLSKDAKILNNERDQKDNQ